MDWKNFFNLSVMKCDGDISRPYFHSKLILPEEFSIEDLQLSNFDGWNMNESEKQRLTLAHRKILHCHHYFKSIEFDRIAGNFAERLIQDKARELRFSTQGGGVYLLVALLKSQHEGLRNKMIICETSEFPLPVIKLPVTNTLKIQLNYQPGKHSYFAGFPSLWATPSVLTLFDPKSIKSKVA